MGILLAVFLLFPHCFSCSARISPTNRAKIVEDYVLSAKFDTKPDLPQLKIDYSKGTGEKVFTDEKFGPSLQKKDTSVMVSPYKKYGADEEPGDPEAYNTLEDREFMIHYHVPPPVPPLLPHPHPPLPHGPAGHLPLAIAFPSFFAVGFIAFLILLNSLQTTLLLTTKTKTLKPLGRRRRFAFAISTPTVKIK